MSTKKPLKVMINEHKTAIFLTIIIITGGSVGIFMIFDIINAQNPNRIILATTTSTYDSGLLDYFLPKFKQQTGIEVIILSVGTGQAIKYGEDGDADVILVSL
ncbi:unnamed protein product, partial [marine sediment metagenome]